MQRCHQGTVSHYRCTDKSFVEELFVQEHVNAFLFAATLILLTRTTCYGAAPAIHFQAQISATARLSFCSIYSSASTHVQPPVRLTPGLTQGVFIEVASCAKRGRKRKMKTRTTSNMQESIARVYQ